MVLAEAVIAAITTLAVSLGFQKVQAETGNDGSINIFGDKDGSRVNIVRIKNPALKSPQYDLVNLTTSAVSKDENAPAYFIQNQASGLKKIFTIGIVPTDATTKTEAIVEVFLNGSRLFPITSPAQGMLSGVTSLNIPIPPSFGLELRESEKLEVFVWNPSGNPVSITFAVFVAVQV